MSQPLQGPRAGLADAGGAQACLARLSAAPERRAAAPRTSYVPTPVGDGPGPGHELAPPAARVCDEAADRAVGGGRKAVDAGVMCAPTEMHATQASACLTAGKHVQVEIPRGDGLVAAQAVFDLQKQTKLVAMCGHGRGFNPSHQWV